MDIELFVIVGCFSDISVILNCVEEIEVVVDWVELIVIDNCVLQSFFFNLELGVVLVVDVIVVYMVVDDVGLEMVCFFEVMVNLMDNLVLYLDIFKIMVDDSLVCVFIFVN